MTYNNEKYITKLDFDLPSKEEVKRAFTADNLVGVGDIFEGYRFEHNIGPEEIMPFLIKRLKPEYLSNPACRAAFKKEFDVLCSLKLWSIPICYQMVDDSDDVYIVLPERDGIPIYAYLKTKDGQRFFRNYDNARNYFAGILRTFAYLHRNGVVFNDLIPGKACFINWRGYFRLYDFERCWTDKDPQISEMSMSAPGNPGFSPHPVPQIDLQSLGLLVRYIASEVKWFPKWMFRGFIRKCFDPRQTAESLLKQLTKGPDLWTIILILSCLFASMCTGIALDKLID